MLRRAYEQPDPQRLPEPGWWGNQRSRRLALKAGFVVSGALIAYGLTGGFAEDVVWGVKYELAMRRAQEAADRYSDALHHNRPLRNVPLLRGDVALLKSDQKTMETFSQPIILDDPGGRLHASNDLQLQSDREALPGIVLGVQSAADPRTIETRYCTDPDKGRPGSALYMSLIPTVSSDGTLLHPRDIPAVLTAPYVSLAPTSDRPNGDEAAGRHLLAESAPGMVIFTPDGTEVHPGALLQLTI